MKKNNPILLFLSAVIMITGCKKENTIINDGGGINITNAVVGSTTLSLLTNPSYVGLTNQISANNFAFVPIASGHTQVVLGTPAVAATATTPAVAAVNYFTTTLDVTPQSNYSLFLTGTSLSAIESVVIREKPIITYKDSVCAVRFINLSSGSAPISVNIQGQANGSEVGSLAYKSYTDFKKYPAKLANSSYTFEFRDSASGSLIRTYTLSTPYFNNVTLALRGLAGGSTGVILVNHYYTF